MPWFVVCVVFICRGTLVYFVEVRLSIFFQLSPFWGVTSFFLLQYIQAHDFFCHTFVCFVK